MLLRADCHADSHVVFIWRHVMPLMLLLRHAIDADASLSFSDMLLLIAAAFRCVTAMLIIAAS